MIILVEKIARRLTRKPKLVAFIGVILLIPALLGIIGTRINYDILTYLPPDFDSSKGRKSACTSCDKSPADCMTLRAEHKTVPKFALRDRFP